MSEPVSTTAAIVNIAIATAVIAISWRATNYGVDAGLKASEGTMDWLKSVAPAKKATP